MSTKVHCSKNDYWKRKSDFSRLKTPSIRVHKWFESHPINRKAILDLSTDIVFLLGIYLADSKEYVSIAADSIFGFGERVLKSAVSTKRHEASLLGSSCILFPADY